MSLFQESIIRKHLGYLDQELVDQAYLRFNEVYSAKKISNIKIAKEEQYQEGFIKDIFGAVLGYSVFPEQPFNIQTEKKNESDSKKADGAIMQGENVVGVIELKDNKTKNLDAVKDQAFGYKNNHKECSYVISSNFHKLRFYLDDATDYEEFDLYNLDKETFKRFYLYLQKEGLLDKNIPKLLRQETKFHEENITKSLYKDYSSFKNSFFQNVVKNNPQYDKLLLFKKSQKFLDKVLFVLFAEDKGLVATNSIVQIVEKWNDLKNDAFDTPKPLYELIALFFSNLFIGKKDQKGGVLIPEFGGEMFAPDEVLDTLIVDDAVLQDDLLKLSKYDFNTDVDVNILGHIFEHSLSEIEEVEASLKGEITDKTKGKRKKDGVFYTPKYITKYIVENTVGKLCSEKKTELKLDVDIAIFEHQKADGKLNAKGIALFETLNQYKDWLLTLKILDPACGSGAFLNQAVNFLVQEHKFVDDIIAELTNAPLRLFDTDIAILENNIYGVDINEESIEIAKLSLWLRTAQQGRRLSNLSNNIKCGNSLIDDPAIAGDKAFNWHNEFPEVFAKGGFDVVIGNPPYVRQELLGQKQKDFFSEKYKNVFNGTADLYVYFYDLSILILRSNGLLGFITPNKWMERKYGFELRNYLINLDILQIVNFGELKIFEDASTEPEITILKKSSSQTNIQYVMIKSLDEANQTPYSLSNYNKSRLDESIWRFNDDKSFNILEKFKNSDLTLGSYTKKGVFYGIKTGLNEAFIINEENRNEIVNSDSKASEIVKKMVEGDDFSRWSLNHSGRYILATQYDLDIPKFYPSIHKFLMRFEEKLIKRQDKGATHWNLRSCDYYDELLKPKLIYYHTATIHSFYFDTEGYYISANCYFIANADRYLQCVLNSKLFHYVKKFLFPAFGDSENGGRVRLDANKMSTLPIKEVDNELKEVFREHAEKISILSREFDDKKLKFTKYFSSQYKLEKLSGKLSNFYELDFSVFIKELNKAIKSAKGISLSKKDEFEWIELFEENKKKALELKAQITQTDNEIDQLVYALYELSEDEIKIVEGS
ncbi:MAG: N-6 DNA methylase [Flavobacteriia bacterium]